MKGSLSHTAPVTDKGTEASPAQVPVAHGDKANGSRAGARAASVGHKGTGPPAGDKDLPLLPPLLPPFSDLIVGHNTWDDFQCAGEREVWSGLVWSRFTVLWSSMASIHLYL